MVSLEQVKGQKVSYLRYIVYISVHLQLTPVLYNPILKIKQG